METTASIDAPRPTAALRWLGHARLAVAVTGLWALLHYVVDNTVLVRGMQRPVLVVASDGGLLAALLVAVIVVAGGLAAAWIAGRRNPRGAVLTAALAMLVWSFSGATIDDWLVMRNPTPGQAVASTFHPLLYEYIYLALLFAALIVAAAMLWPAAPDAPPAERLRKTLFADGDEASPTSGPLALLIAAAVAAVAVMILSGPHIGQTFRGQVMFSVGLGFVLAVLAARHFTHVRGAAWYWPAPLLAGLGGVFYAMVSPGFAPPYENINLYPPNGLVRPLPIEMVSVGLIAIHWITSKRRHGGEASQRRE